MNAFDVKREKSDGRVGATETRWGIAKAIVGLLVLCFLGAVGLCGWVLLPPLLRYLSESNLW